MDSSYRIQIFSEKKTTLAHAIHAQIHTYTCTPIYGPVAGMVCEEWHVHVTYCLRLSLGLSVLSCTDVSHVSAPMSCPRRENHELVTINPT